MKCDLEIILACYLNRNLFCTVTANLTAVTTVADIALLIKHFPDEEKDRLERENQVLKKQVSEAGNELLQKKSEINQIRTECEEFNKSMQSSFYYLRSGFFEVAESFGDSVSQ